MQGLVFISQKHLITMTAMPVISLIKKKYERLGTCEPNETIEIELNFDGRFKNFFKVPKQSSHLYSQNIF